VFSHFVFPLVILYAQSWILGAKAREERVVTATAAIQQAQKIQSAIQRTRECLTELTAWNRDSRHWPGTLATQVRDTGDWLTFECDEKRSEFSVTIHYGFDDWAYVSGSFDGPLTIKYGHFTAPEKMVIPADPDVRALAELLAYGGS
jgi:hypothetical protein